MRKNVVAARKAVAELARTLPDPTASRAHGALAKGSRLETIGGAPPDLSALPPGCAFAERCAWAQDACRQSAPEPVVLAPGHQARCWRTDATAAA